MQNTIENIKLSPRFTDLRGTRLEAIHRASVLLSKQEDLCSTSHYSSRRKNTSTQHVTPVALKSNAVQLEKVEG